ncbi:hypothetical protein BDR22DRAFT_886523 [Usnea florida]
MNSGRWYEDNKDCVATALCADAPPMNKSFSNQTPKADAHRTIRDTNERAREPFAIRRLPSRSVIEDPAIARRPTRTTVSPPPGAKTYRRMKKFSHMVILNVFLVMLPLIMMPWIRHFLVMTFGGLNLCPSTPLAADKSRSSHPIWRYILSSSPSHSSITNKHHQQANNGLWSDSECYSKSGATSNFGEPDPLVLNFTLCPDVCGVPGATVHSYRVWRNAIYANGSIASFNYFSSNNCAAPAPNLKRR